MKIPSYIMIHHTAVSFDKNPDQFEATNKYHQERWNFKSSLGFYVGYNYEISLAGKIRRARADGEAAAACYQEEMNDGRCIHIALDGNFDIEKPAPKQIYALRDLLKKLTQEYSINPENIIFHNQYANKTCPGKNMDLPFIRSLVGLSVLKPAINDLKNQIITKANELIELARKL